MASDAGRRRSLADRPGVGSENPATLDRSLRRALHRRDVGSVVRVQRRERRRVERDRRPEPVAGALDDLPGPGERGDRRVDLRRPDAAERVAEIVAPDARRKPGLRAAAAPKPDPARSSPRPSAAAGPRSGRSAAVLN
jgi:hypothetical protein